MILFPAVPLKISVPASPIRVLFPLSPTIESLCVVPMIFSMFLIVWELRAVPLPSSFIVTIASLSSASVIFTPLLNPVVVMSL